MKPWREEAIKRGYHASIAIPIRRFGKVIGTFTLYSGMVNFFDEEEIALLEKAANDISFALDFIEKEAIRKRTLDSLIKSERRYQALTEVSSAGFSIQIEMAWLLM
jgi:GAF domain-containing protein